MQIKTQPAEVMQTKIQKIRCCTGCLNNVNYLVFGHGLYCSSCLSTLPLINQDQFINIAALSKILVELAQQYGQQIKGQVSQINLMKGQMQATKNQTKKVKQELIYNLKMVKDKSFAQLDQLFAECVKENQNEPLQAFYQTDITATLILNESQLLIQNLANLKISKNQEGKIQYKLKQSSKNPQKINAKVAREYKKLNQCIQSAIIQANGVIDNFLKDIGAENK